tara:strand:+ start:1272 stop:1739 length:468 start_codon:yes stop_codon:yes gene_type:complete
MKTKAVFQNKLKGYVIFEQKNKNEPVSVRGHIEKLKPPGKHGFHIHTFGDLESTDCMKCGGHWNPSHKNHGGRYDIESHAGDLGNITANKDGISNFKFQTNKIQIFGNIENSIIGRSVVIHKNIDDCGKGNHDDSLTTGNSGARIDCAVIGHCSL